MFHSIVDPMEVWLSSAETERPHYVVREGCLCECVDSRVRRLITTDLRDYLNPALTIGTAIGKKTEKTV